MQLGDIRASYDDVESLVEDVGYRPATPVRVGIQKFVDWYCEFCNVSASALPAVST